MLELVARLRALIRRSAGRPDPAMTSGSIKFDTRSGTVKREGKAIDLTSFEQRLLQLVMHQAGESNRSVAGSS
jgi:DNA-binding response OmpR family regulator